MQVYSIFTVCYVFNMYVISEKYAKSNTLKGAFIYFIIKMYQISRFIHTYLLYINQINCFIHIPILHTCIEYKLDLLQANGYLLCITI